MDWVVVLIGLVFALLVARPKKPRVVRPVGNGGRRQHATKGMEDA